MREVTKALDLILDLGGHIKVESDLWLLSCWTHLVFQCETVWITPAPRILAMAGAGLDQRVMSPMRSTLGPSKSSDNA